MAPQKRTMNSGIEILVVEDSPTQAEQLKHILEQHDYSVSVANNGKEALSLINKHKPTICYQRYHHARNGWLPTLSADQGG